MNRIASAYLVALHLCLVVLLAKTDAVARVAVKIGLREAPEDPFISSMRTIQRVQDQSVPAGAVLFLGDSHIQRLSTYAVAPLSVNFGIAGQRSEQLLTSMDCYQSMQRAAAVVVMIGTNDAANGVSPRYRDVLEKVPAGIPVILASAPPMPGFDVSPQAARQACAADPRCTFVDAFAALSGPGMLLPDGMHLSREGYKVLVPLLRRAVSRVHQTTVMPSAE